MRISCAPYSGREESRALVSIGNPVELMIPTGPRKSKPLIIVKAIKNGTLSIPWAKPGGASVSLTSTSVKPRSGSASQNAVPGHLNQESPSDQQVSLNREFKMTYSTDLRRRVIARVRSGDGKSAACRLFGISRSTLHSWLNRADLSPSQNGFRHRKLNRKDFERYVADYPDALQRERAAHFKVSTSSMRHALKRMGATRKKQPRYLERDSASRIKYLVGPETKLEAAPRPRGLS